MADSRSEISGLLGTADEEATTHRELERQEEILMRSEQAQRSSRSPAEDSLAVAEVLQRRRHRRQRRTLCRQFLSILPRRLRWLVRYRHGRGSTDRSPTRSSSVSEGQGGPEPEVTQAAPSDLRADSEPSIGHEEEASMQEQDNEPAAPAITDAAAETETEAEAQMEAEAETGTEEGAYTAQEVLAAAAAATGACDMDDLSVPAAGSVEIQGSSIFTTVAELTEEELAQLRAIMEDAEAACTPVEDSTPIESAQGSFAQTQDVRHGGTVG